MQTVYYIKKPTGEGEADFGQSYDSFHRPEKRDPFDRSEKRDPFDRSEKRDTFNRPEERNGIIYLCSCEYQ